MLALQSDPRWLPVLNMPRNEAGPQRVEHGHVASYPDRSYEPHVRPSMTVPYIDPSVRHVPISYLRRLNLETLRQLTESLVVDGFDEEKPLAVIVPYETF